MINPHTGRLSKPFPPQFASGSPNNIETCGALPYVRDHNVLTRSNADHATVQSQPSGPVQVDHATPVSARCLGGGLPHVVVIVVEVVRQSLHDNGGDDGVD